MKLLKKHIKKIQKNKGMYLMLDGTKKIVPGKSIIGYKKLTNNDWYFREHWPNDPNMPGALQLECMMQLSSLIFFTKKDFKNKTFYLVSINSSRFFKKVLPQMKILYIESKLVSFKRDIAYFEANCFILEKKKALICKSSFSLILK